MAERRILIAIDGSEHSERAFDWYCDNIRHENDVLVLSHTLELPPKPPTPFPYVEGYYENWKKEIELARSESKNILAKHQFICEERNIEILNAVHDERYQPGPSICKVAEENNVSLIILGSRGLSKVRRTFLGSISDYVVHHAHLPVCVVPPYDVEYNFVKEDKTRSKGARTPSPLPADQSKDTSKPKPVTEQEPESKAPESNEPESKAPESNEPESKAPESNEPESKAPESNEPESKAPESNEPESKAPESNEPESNEPEPNEPESNEPEPNESEAESGQQELGEQETPTMTAT